MGIASAQRTSPTGAACGTHFGASERAGITLPPLPAWPPVVYEGEPAHGLFQRLASANGQHSTRSLANSMGLCARRPEMSELLEFCDRFPIAEKQRLHSATPEMDGAYCVISGERFRRHRDWSARTVRACPGCIWEASYHRTWFDLTSFDSCPFHGETLVAGDGFRKLDWGNPSIGVIAETGLSIAAPAPRIACTLSWETYVLGRLGLTSGFGVPLADDEEIFAVIDLAEILGLASLHGWRATPEFGKRGRSKNRCASVRIGFETIREGAAGIERCLRSYALGSTVTSASDRINYSIYTYFGWIYNPSVQLGDGPLKTCLLEAMDRVAAERGIFSRKRRKHARMATGLLTLYELAPQLGLKPAKLREIAVKLGLTAANITKSQSHSFCEAAVLTIRSTLEDLVPRPAACEIAGVEGLAFENWCKRNGVSSFVRLGGPSKNSDQFLKGQLLAAARATFR